MWNVEELDRVIDAAENGPLSEADGQKLKTTLHALVERLARRRNTEKTNCRAGTKAPPRPLRQRVPESRAAAPGHGRNAASRLYRRGKSLRQHANSVRRPLPGMPRGKSVPAERTEDADPHCGTGAAESDRVRDGAAALQCLWRGVHRRGATRRRHGKVRRHRRGDDRAAEVWHGVPFNRMERLEDTTGDSIAGGHAVGVDGAARSSSNPCWTS
jgi:hypothetical protein